MKYALLPLILFMLPAFAESISTEAIGENQEAPAFSAPAAVFPEDELNRLENQGWCEYNKDKDLKKEETFEKVIIILEDERGMAEIKKFDHPITRTQIRSMNRASDVYAVLTQCNIEHVPSS